MVSAPIIDPRTTEQIISQTTWLAQKLTGNGQKWIMACSLSFWPDPTRLIGYTLAQDVPDVPVLGTGSSGPGAAGATNQTMTVPGGTVIDAPLVAAFQQTENLESILVWPWQKEVVNNTLANLIGRSLSQDIMDPAADPNTVLAPAGTPIGPALAKRLVQKAALLPTIEVIDLSPELFFNHHTVLDAGAALIAVFSHFAEIVIYRLNQVPEKNFLAFLNLIGVDIAPPHSARVPVTFQPAPARQNDAIAAIVPAGSRIAAPASQTTPQEVTFETTTALALTYANLSKFYVSLPDSDSFEEQTEAALGKSGTAFFAFRETSKATTLDHCFYVAAHAFQAMADGTVVTLTINTDGGDLPPGSPPESESMLAAYLAALPVQWSYFDQPHQQWTPLDSVSTVQGTSWMVTLKYVPKLVSHPVNGIAGAWLQAKLKVPLPPIKEDTKPIALLPSGKTETFPLLPFGTQSALQRFLYLSLPDLLDYPGALINLEVSLKTVGLADPSDGPQLIWAYKESDSNDWSADNWSSFDPLSFHDGTAAFTRNGRISFQVPPDGSWGSNKHYGQHGCWLRIKYSAGTYTQLPEIEDVSMTLSWQIPIQSIQIALSNDGPGLSPQRGFYNQQPLDLTKDFYPFGQQPALYDTFYLACDQFFEQGAQVNNTISITGDLRQAGLSDANPQLVWEYSTQTGWAALAGAVTENFTAENKKINLSFPMPASWATTRINNQTGYWLRARLVTGNYGQAAHYVSNITFDINGGVASLVPKGSTDGIGSSSGSSTDPKQTGVPIYQLVPATFQPPVIQSLTLAVSSSPGSVQPGRPVPVDQVLTYNNLFYQSNPGQVEVGGSSYPLLVPNPDQSPALYLGFDRLFAERTVTLYFQVEAPPANDVASYQANMFNNPDQPQLVWEYAGPDGWKSLDVLDETQTFARSGLITFIGPPDFVTRPAFGNDDLYWLRISWSDGQFMSQPRLQRILTNTTWASQRTTIRSEVLGGSNGRAGQIFQTAQRPILLNPLLEVREPVLPPSAQRKKIEAAHRSGAITILVDDKDEQEEYWVAWRLVKDFIDSGPQDRHYTIDYVQGQIHFGDGRYGFIPPQDTNNIRLTYQTGGGQNGNQPVKTITQLKSSLPYVQSVTNYEAAAGGTDQEPLDQVKRYGPRQLRHRGKAVAAEDWADLARLASPLVARAQILMPQFDPVNLWLNPGQEAGEEHTHQQGTPPGSIGVIIVPNNDSLQPVPSLALLNEVKAYLQARGGATAHIWVSGPDWEAVSVSATVVPTSMTAADVLQERVQTALTAYLHPLTGGPNGQGWDFGYKPHASDFYALIVNVPGVDHCQQLQISGLLPPESRQQEARLVYSGTHHIDLAQGARDSK